MTTIRLTLGVVAAAVGLLIVATTPQYATGAGIWMTVGLITLVAGSAVAAFAALDAMGEPE